MAEWLVPLLDSVTVPISAFASVQYATDPRESTSVAKVATNPVPVIWETAIPDTTGVLVTVTLTVAACPSLSVATASKVESPAGNASVLVQFPFETGMVWPHTVNAAKPPVSETLPVRMIWDPSAVPPFECETIEISGRTVSTVVVALADVETPARSVNVT